MWLFVIDRERERALRFVCESELSTTLSDGQTGFTHRHREATSASEAHYSRAGRREASLACGRWCCCRWVESLERQRALPRRLRQRHHPASPICFARLSCSSVFPAAPVAITLLTAASLSATAPQRLMLSTPTPPILLLNSSSDTLFTISSSFLLVNDFVASSAGTRRESAAGARRSPCPY